jgi:hypothetical protein
VNLVLVHGDQSTKGSRVEFLEHDTVGWLVAFKDLGLDKGGVGCCGSKFFTDLLLGLSESECSGCQYQLLMGRGKAHSGWAKKLERRISWCFPPEMGLRVWTGARKSLDISIPRLSWREDIPGNKLGTLVDELVESVLTVGTALSPDDGLLCESEFCRVEGGLTPVS